MVLETGARVIKLEQPERATTPRYGPFHNGAAPISLEQSGKRSIAHLKKSTTGCFPRSFDSRMCWSKTIGPHMESRAWREQLMRNSAPEL